MPEVRTLPPYYTQFTCPSRYPRPEHLLSRAFTDPTFKAANSSLRALQATMGNSYKCNAEEHIWVTEAFSVNVFKVWVQAFHVEGDKFGSGE